MNVDILALDDEPDLEALFPQIDARLGQAA